jgi:hypothetical protein
MALLAKAAHRSPHDEGPRLLPLDRLALIAEAAQWSRLECTVALAMFAPYGSHQSQIVACTVPGKQARRRSSNLRASIRPLKPYGCLLRTTNTGATR